MANDSHTGRYPAAVEIYYSVCKPYCAFFAQNAVIGPTLKSLGLQTPNKHKNSTRNQVQLLTLTDQGAEKECSSDCRRMDFEHSARVHSHISHGVEGFHRIP
jgi:hypothetical protein